jgi:peptide/nickel transport system substrate-binding protein
MHSVNPSSRKTGIGCVAVQLASRVQQRLFVALLLGVLLSVTAGCDSDVPDALRFGLSAAPDNLDPRFATDAASTRVNRLLYSRLVDFDEHFQPQPSIADWERITPTHYRFTLRADRKPFHDGSSLTARDVQATYRAVLDESTGSAHRGSLHMIDRVLAVNDDVVDFYLNAADLLFPGRLVIGIMPAALLQSGHPFNEAPVGSGPFRFRSWPQPEQLRIERIADGALVEFQRVQRPDVRVLKLLRGELDVVQGDMPPELIAWIGERQRHASASSKAGSSPEQQTLVVKREGSTFAYLGFNLQDPVVGDLRVRRAIAYALDRAAIIRHLWAGHAQPAGGILPPDHWAGMNGNFGLAHDPQRARELLHDAGYGPDNPLRIIFKTSTNAFRVRIATVIQAQLAEVGISMDVRTYDWGTFYGDIKGGNFQVYSLAWVGIKMPDIFRYVFHSESMPPEGANRGRWQDAQVDSLIDRAERSGNLAEQAGLYRAVQKRALDQLPYVPLWYEDQVFIANTRLRGYRTSRDGDYDDLATATWRVGPETQPR